MMLLGTIQYKEKSAGYWDQPLKISDHIENKKPITEAEWGNYLAGLIEGNGSISEEKIEIRLDELDVSLAYYIKKRIGYGKVIKKSNGVIYELKHLEGLKKVLELIKGKLILGDWEKKSNILNNHWLAGFGDTNGRFKILIEETKGQLGQKKESIKLEWEIKQKEKEYLEEIKKAIGGEIKKNEEGYIYKVTTWKRVKKIIDYFDKYSLNSSKYVSYFKWRKVYRIIYRKEHLTEKGWKKIERINKNNNPRD
jgi:hypothetical protein